MILVVARVLTWSKRDVGRVQRRVRPDAKVDVGTCAQRLPRTKDSTTLLGFTAVAAFAGPRLDGVSGASGTNSVVCTVLEPSSGWLFHFHSNWFRKNS